RLDGSPQVVAQRALNGDVERGQHVGDVAPFSREEDGVADAQAVREVFQLLLVLRSTRAPAAAHQDELRVGEVLQHARNRADEDVVALDAASEQARREEPGRVRWWVKVRDVSDDGGVGGEA